MTEVKDFVPVATSLSLAGSGGVLAIRQSIALVQGILGASRAPKIVGDKLPALSFFRRCRVRAARGAVLAVWALVLVAAPSQAADSLSSFLQKIEAGDLFAGADRMGPVEGKPPFARVYQGDEPRGYVFLNSDVVSAVGYSGKPIHILVSLDPEGMISAVKLVKHSEPIVLIGIPERRVIDFMAGYPGLNVREIQGRARDRRAVDVISGATVTVMVIEDSILRSAVKMAKTLGLGGFAAARADAPKIERTIDRSLEGTADWATLLGDGSVRRRLLTVGEINDAFAQSGDPEAVARPDPGPPDETFIDLYAAPVSVPLIGRSLLGDAEYELLARELEPNQHAVLIFGKGRYSFKGSGYVRGGIFDRIQLVQGDNGVRFRDRYHKRIGDVLANGAPKFDEISLFVVPDEMSFDSTEPWRIELLVQRAIGPVKKSFLVFDLGYQIPENYVRTVAAPTPEPPSQPAAETATSTAEEGEEIPLWKRLWENRLVDVAVLLAALGLLTLLFFFQNALVKHPKLTDRVRIGFLLFTLFWIGYYAQAQLSVVNVLTFGNAIVTEFRWEYFLMEPMIFILWVSVAASLLFWGRGAYCGWLCPFGALQELLNRLAKLAKVPQIRVPWGLHERLWPLKYLIFLGLFGLSFYSLADAERLSEIEPFKTSIVLKFAREWPYVIYAVVLLGIGLFIERFFCRYLCPLGAALAVPGRMRMFEWLKRHKECGVSCQTCAHECMVQAIHPEGHINPNECLYCLNCQTYYWDEHRCPPMIMRRLKRERRWGLAGKTRENHNKATEQPAAATAESAG